jgi:hypothetical protein
VHKKLNINVGTLWGNWCNEFDSHWKSMERWDKEGTIYPFVAATIHLLQFEIYKSGSARNVALSKHGPHYGPWSGIFIILQAVICHRIVTTSTYSPV